MRRCRATGCRPQPIDNQYGGHPQNRPQRCAQVIPPCSPDLRLWIFSGNGSSSSPAIQRFPRIYPQAVSDLRLIRHSPRVTAFGLFLAGAGFALSAVPFRTEIRGVASTASQQSMQGLRTDRPQGYPQHCAQNARRVGPMICTENPPPSPRRLQPVFHNPSPDLSTGWPAAPLRSINPMRARD